MQLYYCEQCHTLVREAEIASKAAVLVGEEKYLCAACNAKAVLHPAVPAPVAMPAAPAAPKFSATSTAHVKIPREAREPSAREKPSAKGRAVSAPDKKTKAAALNPMVLVGGGIGMVLVVLLLVWGLSKNKPAAPKTDPVKPVVVANNENLGGTPDLNAPIPLSGPISSTIPTTSLNTPVPPPLVELPGTDKQPATGEDSPRERMARRELEEIKTWGKEHSGEPYDWVVRLSDFQTRNRTNRVGAEAAQLIADAKVPSRVDQTLAYWKLDESDATDGTALKGKAHITGGHVGRGAVALAGDAEDYVELNADPALNFGAGAPFSIAGWFRTASDFGTLVSFRNSKADSTVLDIAVGNHGGTNAPGYLMSIVRQDGAGKFGSVVGSKVNDNTWHHFALTRNNAGVLRLYLDGAFLTSNNAPEARGPLTTDMRALGMELYWLRIPAARQPQGQGLKGEMDDVRVYAIALTDPEIRELFSKK